jgi:hypothetical protein
MSSAHEGDVWNVSLGGTLGLRSDMAYMFRDVLDDVRTRSQGRDIQYHHFVMWTAFALISAVTTYVLSAIYMHHGA